MSTFVEGGLASVSVTNSGEVDLLTSASSGELGIASVVRWALMVETTQDITVRVYRRVGANCGLVLITGYTTSVTSAAPLSIRISDECARGIKVTAQAASTTATVNCDFFGWRGLG